MSIIQILEGRPIGSESALTRMLAYRSRHSDRIDSVIATRYDRCPTAFFSAVALAAAVIFWL